MKSMVNLARRFFLGDRATPHNTLKSWLGWLWTGVDTDKSDKGNTKWALLYVTIAAILFSLIPLGINRSGSEGRPLSVGAGFIIGFVIFSVMARRLHSTSDCEKLSMAHLMDRCRSDAVGRSSVIGPLALTSIAGFSYVAFSWSTTYVDTAVSAALYEIWPMLWFLAMQYIDRKRYGPHTSGTASWSTYGLLLMGFPAIALVVYSSSKTHMTDVETSVSLFGILLALAAPITGALVASNLLFVDRVLYGRSQKISNSRIEAEFEGLKVYEVEESVSIAGMIVTHIAIAPVTVALAIVEVGSPSAVVSKEFLSGVVIGFLAAGPAGLLLRRAHLVSSRREIISLQYLSPLLALLWLDLTLGIDIVRIDLLIFGTITIIAINILLNSDPEAKDEPKQSRRERQETTISMSDGVETSYQLDAPGRIQPRYGLKSLVLSLLYFGMFVYFRDDIFGKVDFGWDGGNYWAVLALASTVFALLYAFRLTRVESLILAEDYRTLSLARRIELLPRTAFGLSGELYDRSTILRSIRKLNRANSLDDYREAYFQVHRVFQTLANRISNNEIILGVEEKGEIREILTEIDALAHGRQNAHEFAERIALWLIGATIVTLALFVPPESSQVALLLADTFAILLGAVVVFLLAHLSDASRSRADELLMEKDPSWTDQPDGLYVRFRDDRDVAWQRIFSSVLVLGIVVTLILLMAWDRLSVG